MLRNAPSVALTSAWFCVAALALAGCGSATSAKSATSTSSASPGFTGYDWQVVAIRHQATVTRVPARFHVDLRFSPNGRFLADDPINSHSGSFRLTARGFTTSAVGSTAAGYVGRDPVILLTQQAMGAFGDGARATVNMTGNRLAVSVGSYTLTCERRGTATAKDANVAERSATRALANTAVCAHARYVDRLTIGRVNLFPQNHERFTFPAQLSVAGAGRSQAVARALCALPVFPSGMVMCPVDLGINYVLSFSAGDSKLAPVTVAATGCQQVSGLGPILGRSPARWTARSPGFWTVLATAAGIRPAGHATFVGTIAS